MNPKELMNRWVKLCLRKKTIPICLITMTEDGEPHVFTNHDARVLQKVYLHLLQSGAIDSIQHLDNQEN